MNWIIKKYKELNLDELYAMLALRSKVFVVEQNCVYNDLDELDKEAIHIFNVTASRIVAYLRILPENTRFPEWSIGRVVVDPEYRKNGLGKAIMQHAIQYLSEDLKASKIRISAQKYLEKFYADLGFQTNSAEYLEDGIPHIEMILNKKDREDSRP